MKAACDSRIQRAEVDGVLARLEKDWQRTAQPNCFPIELAALSCPREIYLRVEGYVEPPAPTRSPLATRLIEHLIESEESCSASLPVEVHRRGLALYGKADLILGDSYGDGTDIAVRIHRVDPRLWAQVVGKPLEGHRIEANLLAFGGVMIGRWSIVYVCDETGATVEHSGAISEASVAWALDRFERVALHRKEHTLPRCRFDGLRGDHAFCNCRRSGVA